MCGWVSRRKQHKYERYGTRLPNILLLGLFTVACCIQRMPSSVHICCLAKTVCSDVMPWNYQLKSELHYFRYLTLKQIIKEASPTRTIWEKLKVKSVSGIKWMWLVFIQVVLEPDSTTQMSSSEVEVAVGSFPASATPWQLVEKLFFSWLVLSLSLCIK